MSPQIQPAPGDSHGQADKCSALAAALSGVPNPSVHMCNNSLPSSQSHALCHMVRAYVAAQGHLVMFASFGSSQLAATGFRGLGLRGSGV